MPGKFIDLREVSLVGSLLSVSALGYNEHFFAVTQIAHIHDSYLLRRV
jgi:hypothetical protein